VWRIRSCTVIGRVGSARRRVGLPSTITSVPTLMPPSEGRNFDTGSLTCRRPSSTSCISAVVTIGLVME
jgi:hypothetical protein